MPVPHVDAELLVPVEHVAAEQAPAATGWRETGEQAGPAATVGPAGGKNCTYSGEDSNTGFRFCKVASIPCWAFHGNFRTCKAHVLLAVLPSGGLGTYDSLDRRHLKSVLCMEYTQICVHI